MKKLTAVFLCVVMVIGLCGCGVHYNTMQSETGENDGRICVLYNDGYCLVFRDNETGVQYIARAQSGITAMLNPDGTPYTGIWNK